MRIEWFGHAYFLLTSLKGTRVATDPFDSSVGYRIPPVEADYVTVSHEHYDHNAVENVKGEPVVVRGTGSHRFDDVSISGIHTFHDEARGSKRGGNTVFVIAIDGMRVCHLGDLGHVLSTEQAAAIGEVDVLLVPVGGFYTIDAAAAATVTGMLSPKIVVPMHYKTKATSLEIAPVEPFLELVGGGTRAKSATLEIARNDLTGPRRVYVLEYA